MEGTQALNHRYEMIAWGFFFILWGITSLIPGIPSGIGTLGVGIILLGLNLARYVSQIPLSGFTLALGALALVIGTADVLRSLLGLQIELPLFPILLIIIGVIWLVRGATRRF